MDSEACEKSKCCFSFRRKKRKQKSTPETIAKELLKHKIKENSTKPVAEDKFVYQISNNEQKFDTILGCNKHKCQVLSNSSMWLPNN